MLCEYLAVAFDASSEGAAEPTGELPRACSLGRVWVAVLTPTILKASGSYRSPTHYWGVQG